MIGTHTLSRLSRATAVAMFVVALTAPGALAGSKCSVNYPWFNCSTSAGDSTRFVTDKLAPGGGTAETPGYRFISDTLAPGGGVVTPPRSHTASTGPTPA